MIAIEQCNCGVRCALETDSIDGSWASKKDSYRVFSLEVHKTLDVDQNDDGNHFFIIMSSEMKPRRPLLNQTDNVCWCFDFF